MHLGSNKNRGIIASGVNPYVNALKTYSFTRTFGQGKQSDYRSLMVVSHSSVHYIMAAANPDKMPIPSKYTLETCDGFCPPAMLYVSIQPATYALMMPYPPLCVFIP